MEQRRRLHGRTCHGRVVSLLTCGMNCALTIGKTRGLRVRSITPFALGSVPQIESEASEAKTEFWIAIAQLAP
jgi:hypothetical protein